MILYNESAHWMGYLRYSNSMNVFGWMTSIESDKGEKEEEAIKSINLHFKSCLPLFTDSYYIRFNSFEEHSNIWDSRWREKTCTCVKYSSIIK